MNNQFQSESTYSHPSTSPSKKMDWMKLLYDYHIPIDAQLFAKWNRVIQIEGQDVLEKDIPRTRFQEPIMKKQSFRDVLRRIAAFYCKQNGVAYQQGLLEVVYPFALLRRKQFPTKKCYAYFNAFMRKFFPKVLTMKIVDKKKQLPHTILAITLTQCLLRFHFPNIYQLFKQEEIHLSMVLTQELMTIFAKNLQIELAFEIYDYFINKNNPNHLFFMCIAMIGLHEQQIIESQSEGNIHKVVGQLKDFKKTKDLENWYKYAEEIEKKTPQSFIKTVEQFGFSHRSILTYEDLQYMIQSEKFFPGGLLQIDIEQIYRNKDKYVFVTVENRISNSRIKLKTLTIRQLKKNPQALNPDKVYVLAARQQNKNDDLQLLIETAKQSLTQCSVVILNVELFQKQERCQIF